MPLTWDENLSVNVAEIDLQHQQLISMINALNDAMIKGKGKDVMGRIMGGLVNYTLVHFKTEETYFDKFNFPDTAGHKKEHAAFVRKVTEYKDRFEKGELGLPIQIMNFLSDWLRSHIKGADRKYSKFFNDNGLR